MIAKAFTIAALAAAAGAQELKTDKLLVDFNGASGSFKLYTLTTNETRSSVFWNINYKALYEVDASGSKINSRAFPNLDLALSTGTEDAGAVAHVTGSQALVASGNSGIHANLYMRHALYTSAKNITGPSPNVTIPVMANTMKVSYNVTGWTFAAPENKLVLEVKMSDNSGGAKAPRPGTDAAKAALAGHRDDTVVTMETGDGSGVSLAIALESVAYVDGSVNATPVTVTQSGNIYSITFPHFTSSVWYDPTVMTVPTISNGIAALVPSALLAMLVAAVAARLW